MNDSSNKSETPEQRWRRICREVARKYEEDGYDGGTEREKERVQRARRQVIHERTQEQNYDQS